MGRRVSIARGAAVADKIADLSHPSSCSVQRRKTVPTPTRGLIASTPPAHAPGDALGVRRAPGVPRSRWVDGAYKELVKARRFMDSAASWCPRSRINRRRSRAAGERCSGAATWADARHRAGALMSRERACRTSLSRVAVCVPGFRPSGLVCGSKKSSRHFLISKRQRYRPHGCCPEVSHFISFQAVDNTGVDCTMHSSKWKLKTVLFK